jgi:hypothetical protein
MVSLSNHGELLHPELVEGRTMKRPHRRRATPSWFDKLTMKAAEANQFPAGR